MVKSPYTAAAGLNIMLGDGIMKLIKRSIALCLVLVMALTLTACGGGVTASDAKDLVQGNLDEIYLGKFDPEYLKLVDITEEEARQTYEEGLEVEAEMFAYYFDIYNMTDELKEEIIELYQEIYAQSKYTVGEASKLDESTFAVKVQVSPLDIFELVVDASEEALQPFFDKYENVDIASMSDEEYDAYDKEWADAVLDLCWEKLPEMGYGDERSLVIQVTLDEDDYWVMSGDDFNNLDEIIITYP